MEIDVRENLLNLITHSLLCWLGIEKVVKSFSGKRTSLYWNARLFNLISCVSLWELSDPVAGPPLGPLPPVLCVYKAVYRDDGECVGRGCLQWPAVTYSPRTRTTISGGTVEYA